MPKIPKVFCSHRQIDKPKVKEIAKILADNGIEPWVDEWEILPGADFVAAINKGLAECDAGIVFFSNETKDGKWVQQEISALTVHAVEEGKALIPVMLDPDVPLPPLFKARSRLGADQTDQLIDAIHKRTGKPTVKTAPEVNYPPPDHHSAESR